MSNARVNEAEARARAAEAEVARLRAERAHVCDGVRAENERLRVDLEAARRLLDSRPYWPEPDRAGAASAANRNDADWPDPAPGILPDYYNEGDFER